MVLEKFDAADHTLYLSISEADVPVVYFVYLYLQKLEYQYPDLFDTFCFVFKMVLWVCGGESGCI